MPEDKLYNGAQLAEDTVVVTEEVIETDAGLAYVHATRESIATTPVEGKSIIDIVTGFQVGYH